MAPYQYFIVRHYSASTSGRIYTRTEHKFLVRGSGSPHSVVYETESQQSNGTPSGTAVLAFQADRRDEPQTGRPQRASQNALLAYGETTANNEDKSQLTHPSIPHAVESHRIQHGSAHIDSVMGGATSLGVLQDKSNSGTWVAWGWLP